MPTFPAQVLSTTQTSKSSLLTKTVFSENGETIQKISQSPMFDGYAEISSDLSYADLASRLDNFTPYQAFTQGLFSTVPGDRRPITTKDFLTLHPGSSAIARSKDFFFFAPVPGFAYFDIDTGWLSPENCPDIWDTINGDFSKLPELVIKTLKLNSYYIRESTSSRICIPNKVPLKPSGWHLFVAVPDQTQIPQFIEDSFKRLVIAGFGFKVTDHATKGPHRILSRSLIDKEVCTPERILYEASPKAIPPVICLPAEGYIHNDFIFTTPIRLTDEEEAQFKSIDARQHAAFLPVKQRRDAESLNLYVEQETARYEGSPSDIIDRVRARATSTFLTSENYLIGSARILLDSGQEVQVSTILATDIIARASSQPTVYHEQTCHDPVEPEYGKSKAKIFTDGAALIHSFAHGGRKFPMRLSADDLLSKFQEAARQISDIAVLSRIIYDLTVISKIDERVDLPRLKRGIKEVVEGKDNKSTISDVFAKARGDVFTETAEILYSGLDKVLPEEVYVADYFADIHGEDFIYAGKRSWYAYSQGGGWSFLSLDEPIRDRLKPIIENMSQIHNKAAQKIRKASFLRDTMEFMQIKFFPTNRLPDFDGDPNIIATPSGVIDLSNIQFRAKLKTDYTTKSTHIDPIPGPCPHYLQFISNLAGGDPELFEIYEYVFVHAVLLGVGKHFLSLTGPTNTGKSAVIRFFTGLLGDYAGAASPKMFVEQRYADDEILAGALIGKHMVICDEIPPGYLHADMIKKITSGDVMRARLLYQNAVDFTPYCTLIMAGNQHPKLADTDSALTGRLIDVKFYNTFVEPNGRFPNPELREFPTIPDLTNRLQRELPQILYRYMDLARCYRHQSFHVPEIFQATVYDLDTRDIKQQWARECLVVDEEFPNPVKYWETVKSLKESFHTYAIMHGFKGTIGEREFSGFLTQIKVLPARPGDLLLRDTGNTTCVNANSTVWVNDSMAVVRKHVRIINVHAPDQPQISRSEGAG